MQEPGWTVELAAVMSLQLPLSHHPSAMDAILAIEVQDICDFIFLFQRLTERCYLIRDRGVIEQLELSVASEYKLLVTH